MLSFLPPDSDARFPPVEQALVEPNGLLAAGGDLSPQRLLRAYQAGVFPWYEEGQPILWWSPNPRTVLWPESIHVSRRLARTLRKGHFRYTLNRRFQEVVAACAATREFREGTWITHDMQRAYARLHQLGWAHSLEVWEGPDMVGGIYGVAIGRAFFGESMFHRVRDASKAALVRLCRLLSAHDVGMLDCQVASGHLFSMGATSVPRASFIARLDLLTPVAPSGRPFVSRELGD